MVLVDVDDGVYLEVNRVRLHVPDPPHARGPVDHALLVRAGQRRIRHRALRSSRLLARPGSFCPFHIQVGRLRCDTDVAARVECVDVKSVRLARRVGARVRLLARPPHDDVRVVRLGLVEHRAHSLQGVEGGPDREHGEAAHGLVARSGAVVQLGLKHPCLKVHLARVGDLKLGQFPEAIKQVSELLAAHIEYAGTDTEQRAAEPRRKFTVYMQLQRHDHLGAVALPPQVVPGRRLV